MADMRKTAVTKLDTALTCAVAYMWAGAGLTALGVTAALEWAAGVGVAAGERLSAVRAVAAQVGVKVLARHGLAVLAGWGAWWLALLVSPVSRGAWGYVVRRAPGEHRAA